MTESDLEIPSNAILNQTKFPGPWPWLSCLQRRLQRRMRLTLAGQIALVFALIYIPTIIIGTLTIGKVAERETIKSELKQLQAEALIFRAIIGEWEDRLLGELQVVSRVYASGFRDWNNKSLSGLARDLLRLDSSNFIILDIGSQSPDRYQLVRPAAGGLGVDSFDLAKLENLLARRENWLNPSGTDYNRFTASYFSVNAGRQIIFTAWPLKALHSSLVARPTRFVIVAFPLQDLLASTRLEQVDRTLLSGTSLGTPDRQFRSSRRDLPSFVLTGSDGHLLLSYSANGQLIPLSQFNERSPAWLLLKSRAKQKCLTRGALFTSMRNCQGVTDYAGRRYIFTFHPGDPVQPGVGILTILPVELVSQQAARLGLVVLGVGLLMLLTGAAAMHVFVGRLVAPIDEASRAINRLSVGDFNIQLSARPVGEMRILFNSIQQTASRLRSLLEAEKVTAVALNEIETAKGIQKNFLPAVGSVALHADVAAICQPALSVGADWYDVIPVPGGTVFVLADVCDKGVGSALFMSVFRSLIRFFVQEVFADRLSDGCSDQEHLRQVLGKVNAYMALNHSESCMFATIFLALYRPVQQRLVVVNGGHEATMLLADGQHHLQKLQASGPAVGIFEAATYAGYDLDCPYGSWLLMYSDGLPDARNREGERFGHERMEACFLAAIATAGQQAGRGADSVLQEVSGSVARFCAEEPAFDDLTMMVVHCGSENNMKS